MSSDRVQLNKCIPLLKKFWKPLNADIFKHLSLETFKGYVSVVSKQVKQRPCRHRPGTGQAQARSSLLLACHALRILKFGHIFVCCVCAMFVHCVCAPKCIEVWRRKPSLKYLLLSSKSINDFFECFTKFTQFRYKTSIIIKRIKTFALIDCNWRVEPKVESLVNLFWNLNLNLRKLHTNYELVMIFTEIVWY